MLFDGLCFIKSHMHCSRMPVQNLSKHEIFRRFVRSALDKIHFYRQEEKALK